MGSISNYTPDSLDEVYCDFSSVPASKRCDSTVTYIMNSSSSPFLNNPDVQYYTTCVVTVFFIIIYQEKNKDMSKYVNV